MPFSVKQLFVLSTKLVKTCVARKQNKTSFRQISPGILILSLVNPDSILDFLQHVDMQTETTHVTQHQKAKKSFFSVTILKSSTSRNWMSLIKLERRHLFPYFSAPIPSLLYLLLCIHVLSQVRVYYYSCSPCTCKDSLPRLFARPFVAEITQQMA